MTNGQPRGRWSDAYDEAERGSRDRYLREQAASGVGTGGGGCCLIAALALLAAFTLILLRGVGML